MLPGFPPPKNKPPPYRYCSTSAYYDFRVGGQSQKEFDEENQSKIPMAKTRLENWAAYQDVCSSFRNGSSRAVVLLTCRIGQSVEFIKRVAGQWNVLILAYRRRVVGQIATTGRARVFLEGDAPGVGTNIGFGEIFCPGSLPDMAFIWDSGAWIGAVG